MAVEAGLTKLMKIIGTSSIIAAAGDPMDTPQNGVSAHSRLARYCQATHAGPRHGMLASLGELFQ